MNKIGIILLSGGLDSILSYFILKEQNVRLIPLKVQIPFLSIKDVNKDNQILVENIVYHKVDKDYIGLILNPEYGYGNGLNPCIDCKVYMYKIARRYMETYNASFIATGEVLGQRPFSQQYNQIKLIEKSAKLEGLVLRPLSAKLLDITFPEKNGIVDREKLYGISGRSRKFQIELAKKYGLRNIHTSGGCLLTDKNYVVKFKQFIEKIHQWDIEDIELLRIGRHFYYKDTKIILGRNQQENEQLIKYYKEEKFLFIEPPFPGPAALCYISLNTTKDELLNYSFDLIRRYSKKIDCQNSNSFSLNKGPSLHTV
ncbi:MAG: hypothetical protein N2643_04140 [Endomicrobia bacterium]|nr:hypothetical protein [Endomicrobiia bacterium]